ncbi:sugar phosphate nucleotidyltransferase [Clostridium paraputrificum]|uniref:sugar phosphate nucleotidyltransferase n=1 Tax=Clostridium TaxID=1485 RepID=UPI003D35321D
MRAIILAAGMGTRLRPLTLTTPKSLVEVNGQPLLERQVEFLKEKGIDEIIVVTGYLNDKFKYLEEKYGVKLVYNDKYSEYNNIYTMHLVKEYLADSYVIDADNYICKNFIDNEINRSTYFTAYRENFKNEWKIDFNDNKRVEEVTVCNGNGYILSGVSYWCKSDAEIIVKELERTIENGDFKELFWDDIVQRNINKLNLYVSLLESSDIYEIDSLEDLEEVKRRVE